MAQPLSFDISLQAKHKEMDKAVDYCFKEQCTVAFDLNQFPTPASPDGDSAVGDQVERLRAENKALQAENERLKRDHETAEKLTLQRRAVIWLLRCCVTFVVAVVFEELLHALFSQETLQTLQNESSDFIGAILQVNPLRIGASFLGSVANDLFHLHNLNPFVLVMNGAIAAFTTANSQGALAAILVGAALFVGFSWAYKAFDESILWTLIFGPLIAFVMLFVLLLLMVMLWLLFMGGIRALGGIALIGGSLPLVWHYLLLTVYKRTSMDFEDRLADRLIRLL
jgi:hypothetical protein